MMAAQRPRSAQQVADAALVRGLGELSIGRPAVAHQDAGERGAEDAGVFIKAAAGRNHRDRRVGRHICRQPPEGRLDPPAGFISDDHGAGTHGLHQRGVGRRGLGGRAMQHAHDRARREWQPKPLGKQRGDFAERQAQLLIQDRRRRDRFGPICTAAAPSAFEVCSGWRPCTRRPHRRQRPTWTSKRRTTGPHGRQIF